MNELVNSRLIIRILTKLAYASLLVLTLSMAAFYFYFLISNASSPGVLATSLTLAFATYITIKNAVRAMVAPAVVRVKAR